MIFSQNRFKLSEKNIKLERQKNPLVEGSTSNQRGEGGGAKPPIGWR
jgi:hypothetical protein